MLITVFTPTYNRESLLHRLYESLCIQDYSDFEWLIVDDGSTDDTRNVVEEWIKKQSKFPIRYIYKENGGKHTAINRGVKEANGDLFLILDSDDELPNDSLEIISKRYDAIKNDSVFGGVCGVMAHRSGTRISSVPQGNISSCDFIDASEIDLRYKYNVTGDLCEVFRTDVLKEFPFPEFKGEKFCPEALVWNRIAGKYKLRTFNQVVYFRDYLNSGLTSKIVEIRRKSPKATDLCYKEMMFLPIPIKYRIRAFLNLWRFRLLHVYDILKSVFNKVIAF